MRAPCCPLVGARERARSTWNLKENRLRLTYWTDAFLLPITDFCMPGFLTLEIYSFESQNTANHWSGYF